MRNNIPRELLDCRIMEKYSWTYQELLDTPKVVYDWATELMSFDAQRAENDAKTIPKS
jgi:hypothetical protein